MTTKVIRDGKVAVLYSPGHGAGWYSWGSSNGGVEMLFCPELVEAVLKKAPEAELKAIANKRFPEVYDGGADQLKVEWMTVGTRFRIHEYDGSERIVYSGDDDWVTA